MPTRTPRLGAVSRRVFRAYAMLLAAIVLQGVVGYSQYFAGLPVDLIEIHIVGASVLVIASVRFNLVAGLSGPGGAAAIQTPAAGADTGEARARPR